MLAEERKELILKLLSHKGRVLSSELMQAFQVSEDTVRRDLKELAEAGKLKKVHGGAIANTTVPYLYSERKALNIESKSKIGEIAARLIHDGMLIFVDGGTTAIQLIPHLRKDLRATFVTHSVTIALQLSSLLNSKTIILGGQVSPELLITNGPNHLEQARQFKPDLAIIGVHGLTIDAGGTVENYEDAVLKNAFVANAAETVVLAGKEKLGFIAGFVVCAIDDISYLISDADMTELEPFAERGIICWNE